MAASGKAWKKLEGVPESTDTKVMLSGKRLLIQPAKEPDMPAATRVPSTWKLESRKFMCGFFMEAGQGWSNVMELKYSNSGASGLALGASAFVASALFL